MEGENRYYWWRIAISVIFYVIPMLVFGILISVNEGEDTKGLGIQTPVFLFFSDLVIFTLKEQSISFKSEESSALFIYDTLFQSMVLLLIRGLLCFGKEYWLIMYAIIYFMIQMIGAFDFSQTIFIRAEAIRDEQEDIIKIFRIAPLLQAKVGNQIPDLKCHFEYKEKQRCCEGFCTAKNLKTTIASFMHFCAFAVINYLATKDIAGLKSEDIKYWNEFGQEIYGLLSIFISIVGGLYILWYRAFTLSNYQLTCAVNTIYWVL